MLCEFDYQAPADLLKGRVILVTGASDGIGRAAAKSFAAHGATIILVGRTIKKLEAVYDEIEEAGGAQPAIFPLNFETATYKDYGEMAELLQKEFGCIDGILHNAGILGSLTPVDAYSPQVWDQVMQVNFNSALLMTQALLSLMHESKDASLIFTSSSVGRKGRAFWGAYSISKFATEGLMETLADELENISNIRVNSLNPGATRTGMRQLAFPGENPATLRTPDEIMATYLYLMGPDSKGVNGQKFNAQPAKVDVDV
ncbi:YciK family oxidoreductase [Oceanospirillum maris]|uniref:YciK family oxidoreductase n=1 Tax=Oceanospirillum maris TaxID=64977 RepID=UPI0004268653|nr:YciK family oxidoreductase [Oceanospirillum maris]